MTKYITFALVLGILFLSLESNADYSDQLLLGGEATHVLSALDAASSSDDQAKPSQCQHCCHGHTIGLNTDVDFSFRPLACKQKLPRSVEISNWPQAPPTPPPNI